MCYLKYNVLGSKHGIRFMVIHLIMGILVMAIKIPIDGLMTILQDRKTTYVSTLAHV
jgi:hypothetical protein